jgi:hypothetical protein
LIQVYLIFKLFLNDDLTNEFWWKTVNIVHWIKYLFFIHYFFLSILAQFSIFVFWSPWVWSFFTTPFVDPGIFTVAPEVAGLSRLRSVIYDLIYVLFCSPSSHAGNGYNPRVFIFNTGSVSWFPPTTIITNCDESENDHKTVPHLLIQVYLLLLRKLLVCRACVVLYCT